MQLVADADPRPQLCRPLGLERAGVPVLLSSPGGQILHEALGCSLGSPRLGDAEQDSSSHRITGGLGWKGPYM